MTILSVGKLIIDALANNIYYDYQSKRYRYKGENKPGEPITGSFVSRGNVIKLQRDYLEKSIKQFVELTPRIKAGEIGVYKDAGELLKRIHVSHAIIEAGGIDKLTNSDLGTIGNILKQQYYAGKGKDGKPFGLKHMFKDVQLDPSYSEAKIEQRLKMYALSGEISGSIIKQNKAASEGKTYMKRILGNAEHCPDCINYASLGWQLTGTLPMPKVACRCGSNCKCSVIYSENIND